MAISGKSPGFVAQVFHNSVTAWVVLGISLLLTIAGWSISRAYVQERAQDRFDFEVDTAVQAIAKRMQEYEQVLRGCLGLFKSSDQVSRAEWREYVSTLLIDTYWPGIQGVGYAQMLAPDEVEAHVAKVRAEGFSNYRITPGGEREHYTAIVYLEPFSGRNLRAFGYDMFSEPVRREAMQRAADSGQPALSGRVTLVQETDKDVQAGFLVYLPLYKPGVPVSSAAERRAALRGFVYSPFRVKDLLHGILGEGVPVLDYQIYDGQAVDTEQLLYDSRTVFGTIGDPVGRFATRRSLELQGRTWTINFHSRAGFDTSMDSAQPAMIAFGGFIVDCLLFAVIMSLARNRRHMDGHARYLSQVLNDLRVSEQRLMRTHEVACIGSWEIDLESGRMQWSEQAYRIFGLAPGAPIDFERFMSLVATADRDKVKSAWQAALRGAPFDVEHRIEAVDEERWVHLRAQFVFDDSQDAVRAQGSVQDISSRKKSELALNLAARVFEHAREGIMITDADVRLVDVNPMFTEITGYRRDEVMGRNPNILASGRTDKTVYAQMWKALAEAGHWDGEFWNRRKDGSQYLERISISVMYDKPSGRVLNYVGLISDATESRRQQERMRYAAYHDMLTDLPNRYLLNDRLRVAVARAQRHKHSIALAFIDLDGFKPINDTFGHDVGDRTLVEVAQRLKENLRDEDTVARIGGDEFALLFCDQINLSEIEPFAERLLGALAKPYRIDDHDIRISASIGIALFPRDAGNADHLLRAADKAMYEAKGAGRNRVRMSA